MTYVVETEVMAEGVRLVVRRADGSLLTDAEIDVREPETVVRIGYLVVKAGKAEAQVHHGERVLFDGAI